LGEEERTLKSQKAADFEVKFYKANANRINFQYKCNFVSFFYGG
jgi:hypothetical protein